MSRGTWSLVLTLLAAASLAALAADPLRDAIASGTLWREITAWTAIAAVPIALVALVLVPERARR